MRAGDAVPGDGDLGRLRRVLGTPETAWLLPRMRARLESTGLLTGRLVKSSATAAERTTAARLTGRPVRAGQAASVSLDELDEMLRNSGAWPAGLISAVVALTGEVILPDARSAERTEWQRVSETLRELAREQDAALPWVTATIRSGALKRASASVAHAQALADALVLIARALPSPGEARGVFSARVAGNAHALDASTSLGGLATGLAFSLGGSMTDAAAGSARWRRDAWQSVGIVVDELSSTVLTLGLPGGSSSPTARALADLAGAGQPAILTLRQLLSDDIGKIPAHVFACENPAVVAAAADRWGAASAALVCLSGQPGAAVVLLLQAIASAGATVRYHGDFDWGGMAIARTLSRHVRWEPWRFDAAAYEGAIARTPDLPPLLGSAGLTPWDPDLGRAMVASERKIEEEVVLDLLLGDLNRFAGALHRDR